jgi:hypothetical protein
MSIIYTFTNNIFYNNSFFSFDLNNLPLSFTSLERGLKTIFKLDVFSIYDINKDNAQTKNFPQTASV